MTARLLALAAFVCWACFGEAGKSWRNPKDGMEFVWVPAGELIIGCTPDKKCFETTPATKVGLTGFWMGRTEVTVAQFRAFVKATGYQTEAEVAADPRTWRDPGFKQGPDHPVVAVSFADVQAYARSADVDVPTYNEWEYAARAGSPFRYFWGAEFDRRYAWFRVNSGGGTHPVATRDPNPYGLYDVSGNAWEWSRSDPSLADKCNIAKGVPRGGSWATCFISQLSQMEPFSGGKCGNTGGYNDDHGFRCVRRTR